MNKEELLAKIADAEYGQKPKENQVVQKLIDRCVVEVQPKVQDLIDLGNACCKKNVVVASCMGDMGRETKYVSNFRTHRTGFRSFWEFGNDYINITGVGIAGGSRQTWSVEVTPTEVIVEGTTIDKITGLTRFLEEFPKFEEEFLNEIEELNKNDTGRDNEEPPSGGEEERDNEHANTGCVFSLSFWKKVLRHVYPKQR